MEMKLVFSHLDRTPNLETVAEAQLNQALNGLGTWIENVRVRLGMENSPRQAGADSFFCEIEAASRKSSRRWRIRKSSGDLYAAMEEASDTLRDVLAEAKKKYLTTRNHPKHKLSDERPVAKGIADVESEIDSLQVA